MPLSNRITAAAPDFVTAGAFLWCWIAPMAWRKSLASELSLIIFIEFFVLHAGPFIGGIAQGDNTTMSSRIRSALILGVLYALLAAAFALTYSATWWWPVLVFAWLIAARVISVLSGRERNTRERKRQRYYWGMSVFYFIGGVFLVLVLPVPKLGFANFPLTFVRPWTIEIHTVIAWGFLYFTALGLTKLFEKQEWVENATASGRAET